jgi:sialic acid synthase SpsE
VRPGFGLAPKHLDSLMGRKLKQDVSFATAVAWELVS